MRRAVIALAAGGLFVRGACTSDPGAAPTSAEPGGPATAASTATPSPAPSAAAQTAPVVEKRTVTETRVIPYTTRRTKDSALAKGTTKVRVKGREGLRSLTYELAITDGAQTSKELVRSEVVKRPVTRVVAVGTRSTRRCDPNYAGACVPIAADVDCAGNSGNGPAYVRGPVRGVGYDVYDLDRDGDRIACD